MHHLHVMFVSVKTTRLLQDRKVAVQCKSVEVSDSENYKSGSHGGDIITA